MDWAANGPEGGAVNMWEHFGIKNFPRVVEGINNLLNGNENKELDGAIGKITAFANSPTVASFAEMLKDKESLAKLQNIAESVAKIFESDTAKVLAAAYATKLADGKEISMLDRLTEAAKVVGKLEILREKLDPLFGVGDDKYGKTKAILDNIVDLADSTIKKLSIENIYHVVEIISQVKSMFAGDSKDSKPLDPQQIGQYVDNAVQILDKINKSNLVESAKKLTDAINSSEIDFSGTEKFISNVKGLISKFSSSEEGKKDERTVE